MLTMRREESIKAFDEIEVDLKKTLQHLRHETNKHEPSYFAAVQYFDDHQLTSFNCQSSLLSPLSSPFFFTPCLRHNSPSIPALPRSTPWLLTPQSLRPKRSPRRHLRLRKALVWKGSPPRLHLLLHVQGFHPGRSGDGEVALHPHGGDRGKGRGEDLQGHFWQGRSAGVV
jgi:hypothetical protein